MSAVSIRSERAGDTDAIHRIVTAAFPRPAEAALVDALRVVRGLTLSLVAEQDSEILGHIAFSPVTVAHNPQCVRLLGLGPVAVAPARQHRGIGRKLIAHGLDGARRSGFDAVIVLGSPAYYSRSGFESAKALGLTWGDGSHDDYLQVIGLVPGVLHGLSGAVHYHAAFGSL